MTLPITPEELKEFCRLAPKEWHCKVGLRAVDFNARGNWCFLYSTNWGDLLNGKAIVFLLKWLAKREKRPTLGVFSLWLEPLLGPPTANNLIDYTEFGDIGPAVFRAVLDVLKAEAQKLT